MPKGDADPVGVTDGHGSSRDEEVQRHINAAILGGAETADGRVTGASSGSSGGTATSTRKIHAVTPKTQSGR